MQRVPAALEILVLIAVALVPFLCAISAAVVVTVLSAACTPEDVLSYPFINEGEAQLTTGIHSLQPAGQQQKYIMKGTGKGKWQQQLSPQQWLSQPTQQQQQPPQAPTADAVAAVQNCLEYDTTTGLFWPKHSHCVTAGCGGNVTLFSLITYPETWCWFCGQCFLSRNAQQSVHNQQQQLIEACGGLQIEEFSKSKMYKDKYGHAPALSGKGKVKGKFDKSKKKGTDKGKGKDKDKGKSLTHSNTDIRKLEPGSLAAAVFERVATATTPNSAANSAKQTPASSRNSSVAPAAAAAAPADHLETKKDPSLTELFATCSSIEELKGKLGMLPTAPAPEVVVNTKSVCSANHECATAVAKAFRLREDIANQLQNVKDQMVQLESDYQEHLERVRSEYRLMRDTMDEEQDRMMADLRKQKDTLKEQLAVANDSLNAAHEAQQQFYNASLPKSAAAEPMDVDPAKPNSGGGGGRQTSSSPTRSAEASDKENLVEDHSVEEVSDDSKDKKDKKITKNRQSPTPAPGKGGKNTTGSGQQAPAIQKSHFNKKEGQKSNSSTGQGSKPSEDEDAPPAQHPPIKYTLQANELQHVMQAVSNPPLLEDEAYISTLQVVLNKFGLDFQTYTTAVQQADQSFFDRFVCIAPELPPGQPSL